MVYCLKLLMNFEIGFGKYTTSMNPDRHFNGFRHLLWVEVFPLPVIGKNSKRQSVPRDQVSHLLVVNCSFFLHIN